MAAKTVPLMLRLPSELHKRLAREAKKAGRSLNQELVARLEESLEGATMVLDRQASKELSDTIRRAFEGVAGEKVGRITGPTATPSKKGPLIRFTHDEDEK